MAYKYHLRQKHKKRNVVVQKKTWIKMFVCNHRINKLEYLQELVEKKFDKRMEFCGWLLKMDWRIS